ncbi:penicillin acylase [Streptomyces spiroverticillatus]|uniref:Penicillin acylase n=1 Tax=Streptomyces finlayi TaxID=67296 RepID=A0A918X0S1_9ACTN|nr:penicillin acylase [Streptomyces spiroverticillatus]GHD01487.1 penicillin acylase [Streptomyces finlayi]
MAAASETGTHGGAASGTDRNRRPSGRRGRQFPGEYVRSHRQDRRGHLHRRGSAFGATGAGDRASRLFGGGGEVQSALSLLSAQQKYGVAEGTEVWESFRQRNDPEAALTLHDGQRFPYAGKPAQARAVALPDKGSVTAEQLVHDRTGAAQQNRAGAKDPVEAPEKLKPAQGMYDEGVLPGADFATRRGMSNALLVSGRHTASGNPVAVFGPQTGYFAPQLLMLQELQGPGISARGASFAGVGMYVQLGRGQDYAWSATSAGQDITDTYAVDLCEPGGGAPTRNSTHYLFRGACTPMEKLEKRNAWKPTVADSTAAGSYRMQVWRTRLGTVTHRATVGGRPVAYTLLRSTYRHEADSIIGFQLFNDPTFVKDAKSFQKAAESIDYAFNWFYADANTAAYYNSGLNPQRAPGVDPALPIRADRSTEWPGFDPADNTASYTPPAQHPQSTDQDYYVSWNNKQAADYSSAGFGNGSVHRGNLLDDRVERLVRRGGVTRASLTQAMAEAAVTDLRGEDVLPELLKVLRTKPVTDPELGRSVQQLEAWRSEGAQRRENAKGSRTYTHPDAVRLMDAWWPLLVEGTFKPGLGDDLYQALTANLGIDESPSSTHGPTGGHAGSAFQYGWWSYVDKDLRTVLGQPVRGALAKPYCGNGDLNTCRDTLLATLRTAAAKPAAEVYPGDDTCAAGDQWCADTVQHRALGGLTQPKMNWQNRPTYQMVMEFPKHR